MSTLPPPSTKFFPENSIERKVYDIVDNLSEYLPVVNDRNRLGFCLYKYVRGEGDHPDVLVKSSKLKIEGISEEKLAAKISEELKKIQ